MRKLTYENWKELQYFIDLADYNEYNSNTMTLLMWANRYEVFFETYTTYAIAYTKMPSRSSIWLMPFCKSEDRYSAMEKIRTISNEENIAFEIHSMVKEFKDYLVTTYPFEFLIWDCYDAQDYVYDRQQQETLIGKKMQKRRNHFNAFLKLYESRFTYKPLEKTDVANVYALLETWKSTKSEDELESITSEEVGIHHMLDHLEETPILGGCIYIDGKLEAFNIASYLSKDTVQIHVEKANREIRGLYIAILKLFLETLNETILYVNREDDMGLTELRKAKKDMHPIKKIHKFGSCYQKQEIIKANDSWLASIKELWLASFEEETQESMEFYFNNYYQHDDTYLLISNQELICMLQARKMEVSINQLTEQVSFIYGVATNKEYEGCGYMKSLLNHVLQELAKHENYTFLQAYNWNIYTSFGFQECYQHARYKLDKKAYGQLRGEFIENVIDIPVILDLYQAFTKDKNGYRIRDIHYYEKQLFPYISFWKQKFYLYVEDGIAKGYIIFEEEEDEVRVVECIYKNEESLTGILASLSLLDKKVYINLDISQNIEGRRKEETCMMVKKLNKNTFPDNQLFIHEEF